MPDPSSRAVIDNRTGLPDRVVEDAVQGWAADGDGWVETVGLQFGRPSSFQTYANDGSMLARRDFMAPGNVYDEIRLARDLVDRDDDVGSTVGGVLALAFGQGMKNFHPDEATVKRFNAIAKDVKLDAKLKELYREYLIAGQVTSVSLYSRKRLSFTADSGEEVETQMAVPRMGVLHAENIRVVGNDLFGDAPLAYKVTDPKLAEWLNAYFSDRTLASRKHAMAAEEPITAALFTGRVELEEEDEDFFGMGYEAYTLNPRYCQRTCMPKGAMAHPRPPLTRNFALLEAKRLLNIMDYALLQGGTNYIVIAKKGSDQIPAQSGEVENLKQQVATIGRSGVMVGDHRLSIEVVTPDLSELLSGAKRRLLSRKLTRALLRLPDILDENASAEADKKDSAWISSVVMSDRLDLKRHVEANVYEEVVKRNRATFTKGSANLWFPKVVLSGFTDWLNYILKLRDRGDISRSTGVEVAGFAYEAELAQREREIKRGDDDILIPGEVPFNAPGGAPGDTPDGRPPGSGPGNGHNTPPERLPAPPRRRRGEPVKAWWDGSRDRTMRLGEVTGQIISEYDEPTIGRVTDIERTAIEQQKTQQRGPLLVVPVNFGYPVEELRAIRLDGQGDENGVSLVVGNRKGDDAIVAKAICFREPKYTLAEAEERARRWGFSLGLQREPEEATAKEGEGQEIHLHINVHNDGGVKAVTKKLKRDEKTGAIMEIEEVPVEPADAG